MITNINQNQDNNLENEINKLKLQLRQKDAQIKQLEYRLQERVLIFNTILDTTLAGFWDWYIQENYEYMSPTFKKMFGYEPDEMPDTPEAWQKIIHPDDLASVFKAFDEHVESKGTIPYDNEVRYFHKNGQIVWVYCRGQIIEWDDKGNPLRMVGCHVDITDLKKIESLKNETEILKNKNRELEQFTYIASHDLQEPLRTITSFSNLLQNSYPEEALNDTVKKSLVFIQEATERMSILIKGLLDYARIGRQGELTKVNLQDIVNNLIKDLDTVIAQTNTTILVDKLPVLNGYPMNLSLLFQNIITNAIKFKRRNVDPTIKISVKEQEKAWEFSVEDNGIGISEHQRNKVFMIFQRLHLKGQYEGSGIGLAHCQKIVEIHNGKIWVDSAPEHGCIFRFTISKKL